MSKGSTRGACGQTRRGVVPIRDVSGHVVAGVRGDVLQKEIHGSRHLLRRPYAAIAFDLAVLRSAEALGATVAEVTDLETSIVYRASLAAIRRGLRIERGGFGPQLALALSAWRRDDEPAAAQQLALWA